MLGTKRRPDVTNGALPIYRGAADYRQGGLTWLYRGSACVDLWRARMPGSLSSTRSGQRRRRIADVDPRSPTPARSARQSSSARARTPRRDRPSRTSVNTVKTHSRGPSGCCAASERGQPVTHEPAMTLFELLNPPAPPGFRSVRSAPCRNAALAATWPLQSGVAASSSGVARLRPGAGQTAADSLRGGLWRASARSPEIALRSGLPLPFPSIFPPSRRSGAGALTTRRSCALGGAQADRRASDSAPDPSASSLFRHRTADRRQPRRLRARSRLEDASARSRARDARARRHRHDAHRLPPRLPGRAAHRGAAPSGLLVCTGGPSGGLSSLSPLPPGRRLRDRGGGHADAATKDRLYASQAELAKALGGTMDRIESKIRTSSADFRRTAHNRTVAKTPRAHRASATRGWRSTAAAQEARQDARSRAYRRCSIPPRPFSSSRPSPPDLYDGEAPSAGMVSNRPHLRREALIIANDATVRAAPIPDDGEEAPARPGDRAENRLLFTSSTRGRVFADAGRRLPDREHFGRIFFNQPVCGAGSRRSPW